MDSSRRAVESYWRSRMIDAATSDEDKVTPVYKLEEICDLLRSSHVSIVKEVSDFILKRLEHRSPIVKQKALRLIKYAVVKSGTEFRREMQRHSVVMRQLFHYKGQVDPLKGDSLNKAVRDTAHEAISAIFSEDNKPAPEGDINRRIQGFGNTNYEMPLEDKKSFISEVVGFGSASIKQGINSFTQGSSSRKNDSGSYRSPNLRRSLTAENDFQDKYEPVEYFSETQGTSGTLKNVTGSPWNQDSRITKTEKINRSSSSYTDTTREVRLLETIVTSGGVRLQPTRDAIQVFLVEAAKLDALAISHALDSKLQSPIWQVRMKAVCVLEAILRKKDDQHFSVVASYFSENADPLLNCSESPQASLREKASKVLSLLDGYVGSDVRNKEESVKGETTTIAQLPDLIDTGDQDDYGGVSNCTYRKNDQNIANLAAPPTPLIDDLFGDGLNTSASVIEQKDDDDPFGDVSFHTTGVREQVDPFSGMTIDDNQGGTSENLMATDKNRLELFDIFGSGSDKKDVNELIGGLSVHAPKSKQDETLFGSLSETMFTANSQVPHDALNGMLGSQVTGLNANPMLSSNIMPYNIPPGIMLNPVFPTQSTNYGTMGNFIAQQQLLATMSNFQPLGNLSTQNIGGGYVTGTNGGYISPLPDIFQPNFAAQPRSPVLNNSKKEETKAFDFISDHVAAARDPKRVV